MKTRLRKNPNPMPKQALAEATLYPKQHEELKKELDKLIQDTTRAAKIEAAKEFLKKNHSENDVDNGKSYTPARRK